MKTINRLFSNPAAFKNFLVLVLLLISMFTFGQTGGTHPGYDPTGAPSGMSVPIDGGILTAILALSSLGTMLLKKKKGDKKIDGD
jgi:hypothetical protein